MNKPLLSFLFAFFASIGLTYASSTSVDGIWYDFDFNNHTATVTYKGSSHDAFSDEYTGEIVIPAQFTSPYDNNVYTVVAIGQSAFRGCNVTSVTLPNTITSIGGYAFADCDGLIAINIPTSVTSIQTYAFYSCSKLASIDIPNSVTAIGTYAFNYCTDLKEVNIATSTKNVTSIGGRAFARCTSLTSISLANGTISFGPSVFDNCKALTKVNITDLAAWCNSTFNNGQSNPFCYAPDLFLNNTKVADLVIPNDITNINAYCFFGCKSISSITFHKNVTSIGKYAFNGCSNVSTVTAYMANPPSISTDVFGNMGDLLNINCYVPTEAYLKYLQADTWKDFNLIPFSPTMNPGNVWTGDVAISWNQTVYSGIEFDTYTVQANMFAGIQEGNWLVFHFAEPIKGAQFALAYKAGDDWAWIDLAITYGDTFFAYRIESQEIATSIANRGLVVRGQGYHLTGIDYRAETPDLTTDIPITTSRSQLVNPQKSLINSQLFILRDGKTYTVQGLQIK